MLKKIGRVWKYSLGSFSDDKTNKYDNTVCIIRTFILASYLITNTVIIAGVIRHWNSNDCTPLSINNSGGISVEN